MEAPPAKLREESFRGPTSLKTASVIAVMPTESLLILRGKHRKKLLKFDRTICTTTWRHVLTKVAWEATTVRYTKSILTCRFWSRVTVLKTDHSYSMICDEDDEDASDKNTDAIGLELEQSQRSRSRFCSTVGCPQQSFKK